MIDQQVIQRIIESNDIVSIVEQYLPLKKSGTNYKACCPFHEENTPSFVVSERKQIYKCFGCGKGGNVLHFIQEMEKITFYEAIQKLASRAGIVLERRTGKRSTERKSRTSLIVSVYELAKDYYCNNLNKFGETVVEYLKSRDISDEMIARFELGYALNSTNGLYNYLIKHSINKDIIIESGLVTSTQYGYYDRFQDRLVFPIHSAAGRVVAFGARALSTEYFGGKYINSPTTPIYTKGNELYGFHLTKNEIGKKNAAIITEGYLDFIRLYETGFTNSVAALGTALTGKQINLISRYTPNFYLLFDGDKAGKKAAIEAAKRILNAGKTPFIIELPIDEDADSYLRAKGERSLIELIEKKKTLTQFVYDDKLLFSSPQEKIEELLDAVAQIPDLLTSELLTKQISEIFRISHHSLTSRKQRLFKRDTSGRQGEREDVLRVKYIEEKFFLIYMLNGLIEDNEQTREITADYFFVETYKKVFEHFVDMGYIIDEGVVMSVITALEDKEPSLVGTISELSMADEPDTPVESVIIDLKLRKYRNELETLATNTKIERSTLAERIKRLEERNNELMKLSTRVIKKIF